MSTTPMLPHMSSMQAGSRLGKYVILAEIGRGGMAVVYKAHQPDLDRVVAVKVLFGTMLQQRFIDRFQGEARALAKMNHPNVIRIFEVGEQNGAFYLVMEYIQGVDLLRYLHEKKPSFDEVLDIVHQMAEALAYCHKQGILHRDLKPTNILMRGQTPVLIDFGLAKAVDPELNVTLTLSGEVIGSPAYMSPEQAQGQDVGVLSDICSLGIIMYELISFKNPYLDPRSLHQTALNAIQAEPVPLRYLSPWLDSDFAAIVAKSMAKNFAERYVDMEQLLQDLHSFRLGQPIMAKPPGFFQVAWRFLAANPVLYMGAIFLLVIGSIVGGFLFFQHQNAEAPFGLVLEESFSNMDSVTHFASLDYNGKEWLPSTSWRVIDGHLEGNGKGLSCAVTDQEFFGDLRVEFKVQGVNGANGDFNAFLFGPTPEEGFRFTLGEWGSGQANIEFGPRVRFPHGGAPVRLNGGIAYKVTLEKEGHYLRLYLEDHLLVEKFYPLPVKIDRSSKIGFYTWSGGMAVDDIRIYKKAVALAANPTVVADAYQEEGFIQHSIPAYRHVIETYAGKSASFEAHLKLGKSFMVLGDFPAAIQNLSLAAGSKDRQIIPEALFQLAQCQFETGRASEGYERLKLLHQTFPESEFNRAVVENRVEAVYNCLDHAAQPGECVPRFEEEFRFLIQNEDLFRSQFGSDQANLLELFRRSGVSSPFQNASKLLDYYAGSDQAKGMIEIVLARQAMGQGRFAEAVNLLADGAVKNSGDRNLAAEQAMVLNLVALLQGNTDVAEQGFVKTGQDFSDVPGIPFRCEIHSEVAKILSTAGGTKAVAMDNALLSNNAVSNRERRLLEYKEGKLNASFLALPPQAPQTRLPGLEEILIEYLRRGSENPALSTIYIQSVQNLFPSNTLEAAYLQFLLTHHGNQTVFVP